MAKLKIGIIGCGAIGSSLAGAIILDLAQKTALSGLYDIKKENAVKLAGKLSNLKLVMPDLKSLIRRSDFIIEATRAEDASSIAEEVLSSSRSIMIMSVGGIIGKYQELTALAEKKKVKIFIPSGAICGIDGLKALSVGKISRVVLTTKKPPKAFEGVTYLTKKNINLDGLTEEKVVFDGNADLAVIAFPQNINVAAAISIAGIGPENTVVRIVASPHISRNIHEIEIESEAGKIFTRTENVIHPDNPKTSFLAVLSAIAALKGILSPIKIGT
jgi:aspartate dehydrogenase